MIIVKLKPRSKSIQVSIVDTYHKRSSLLFSKARWLFGAKFGCGIRSATFIISQFFLNSDLEWSFPVIKIMWTAEITLNQRGSGKNSYLLMKKDKVSSENFW
jgi:hypothetical protein